MVDLLLDHTVEFSYSSTLKTAVLTNLLFLLLRLRRGRVGKLLDLLPLRALLEHLPDRLQ